MHKDRPLPTLTVELEDALRVFKLMEELNDFLHQPSNYTPDRIERFSQEHYEEVRRLYYDVIWSWLPPSIKERIEAGEDFDEFVRPQDP